MTRRPDVEKARHQAYRILVNAEDDAMRRRSGPRPPVPSPVVLAIDWGKFNEMVSRLEPSLSAILRGTR